MKCPLVHVGMPAAAWLWERTARQVLPPIPASAPRIGSPFSSAWTVEVRRLFRFALGLECLEDNLELSFFVCTTYRLLRASKGVAAVRPTTATGS